MRHNVHKLATNDRYLTYIYTPPLMLTGFNKTDVEDCSISRSKHLGYLHCESNKCAYLCIVNQ